MKHVALFALLAAALAPAEAHMSMKDPIPRGSKYGPWSQNNVDYDLVAPLGPTKPFPCGGKPAGAKTATLVAGKQMSVKLEGSAVHKGGHCQFSVSYDNGKTWLVLSTVRNNCMLKTLTYKINLPKNLPACDNCIFSWNWINAAGNREFYMNCADVSIQGPRRATFRAPKMLVANIQGPIIPEFNQEWIPGGGYAGLDLLDKRPIVTVYGPDGPAKKSRGIGRRALKAKAKKAIEEAEKSA